MTNAVIITGGAQRVGKALAIALAQQGFDVVISYRTMKPAVTELRELGIHCQQADFSSQTGIDDFIGWINQKCGSIRALIHNASDWLAESADVSPQQTMNQMMQIHAMVPYQLNLALAELLQTSTQGDIIHLTDYVVKTGSKKHIAYAASKSALENMTKSFAALLAPKVKVNAIAPGLIMFNEHDDERYREKAKRKSLMAIEPGPQVVIDTINYIINNPYLTGSCVDLDGGRALASKQ
ncbi:dihydromonapterin reductase [Neiella litorisoli]|uniref:dihydromonapterin reductase n=1 Tax=Neiella litorisoli TaxID=2771431 RepID=UPI001CD0D4E1|nr:dihydromonapterin reductase [Neiella litorisoli]